MAYDKYKKAYPATDCQGQGQGEKIFQTKSARKRAPPDGEPGNETGKRGGNRSDTIEIKLKGFDCFPKTASKWNANEVSWYRRRVTPNGLLKMSAYWRPVEVKYCTDGRRV